MKGFKWEKWIKELNSMVDDHAWDVYVPTPEGWKCTRSNCKSDVKHIHSTFNCLKNDNLV